MTKFYEFFEKIYFLSKHVLRGFQAFWRGLVKKKYFETKGGGT